MTIAPRLAPCPHCRRHVRVTETACPFCAAPIAAGALSSAASASRAPASHTAPPVTRRTLGRAALFAFGSALATTAPGCYLTHERGEPIDDRIADAWHQDDAGAIGVLYGAAPDVDAGARADGGIDAALDVDAAIDEGAPITLYGGPFPIDPIDAGPLDAAGSNNALYGGPPEEGGGSNA